MVIGVGLWLTLTAAYGFALASSNGTLAGLVPSLVSPTAAIRTLNVLSHGTTILLGMLVIFTLDAVLWALACSPNGINFSTLLGLTSSTGKGGLVELLLRWFNWRIPGAWTNYHRILGPILRYLLLVGN